MMTERVSHLTEFVSGWCKWACLSYVAVAQLASFVLSTNILEQNPRSSRGLAHGDGTFDSNGEGGEEMEDVAMRRLQPGNESALSKRAVVGS